MTRRKFTLTEFLVAITLSLIIFSFLAFSISSNVKIWFRGQDRLDLVNDLVSVDRVVKSIFNSTKPFRISENKLQKLIFDGTEDKLDLVYQHRVTDYEEGTIRFISLYWQDNQLKAKYYSRYEDYLSQSNYLESILINGITKIRFFYAGESNLESLKVSWYNSWQNKKYLPLAIRLQITLNEDKTENFLWRISNSSLHQRVGNFTEGTNK